MWRMGRFQGQLCPGAIEEIEIEYAGGLRYPWLEPVSEGEQGLDRLANLERFLDRRREAGVHVRLQPDPNPSSRPASARLPLRCAAGPSIHRAARAFRDAYPVCLK